VFQRQCARYANQEAPRDHGVVGEGRGAHVVVYRLTAAGQAPFSAQQCPIGVGLVGKHAKGAGRPCAQ
jgi:hypothetical protein